MKILAREKCAWKNFAKFSVRPSTIGYMCKELQSICSDYDGSMAHSKHAVFLEARIFPNFDRS